MKIALFTDCFEDRYGGATVYVRNLAEYLKKQGHIVRVFVWESEWITVEDRKICATFPALNIAKSVKGKIGISTLKILREVNFFSPDLIHNHSQFSMGVQAIIISRKLEIPIINHYHTYLSGVKNHLPSAFQKYAKMTNIALKKETKTFFSLSDLIIAPTRTMKNYLQEIGVKKEIEIVPFGIDMNIFKRNEICKQSKFTILYVGRLTKEKNIEDLLNLFAQFVQDKDVLLKIVGVGLEKDHLENLTRELKIDDKVQFMGWVAGEALSREYNSANLFMMLSEMETFGIAILEAMACGLPIIGANVLAIPELVLDGVNGFLVDRLEYEYILKKMNKIYKDKNLETFFSDNSIALSKQYESSKVFGELEKIYIKLIKQRSNSFS